MTTEQENEKAQNLYLSIGFEKADELDGDDFVYLYKGREDNGDLGRISV